MMLRKCTMACCGVLLVLTATGVASATTYTVTDLGVSSPGWSTVYGSYPMSVNNSGQTVGYISVTTSTNASERRAAIYSGGTWTDIGTSLAPGNGITPASGKLSMATSINNSGLVAGWYAPSGLINGVTYTYQLGTGATTYLSNVPGVLNYTNYQGIHNEIGAPFGDGGWKKWTSGGGLNNSGQIAGWYYDSGAGGHQFLFDGTQTSEISISPLQTAVSSYNYATGINDAGVVISHAALWDGVHGPPGMSGTGWYTDGSGIHALSIVTPTFIAGNYVVGSNGASPFVAGLGQICTLGGVATNLKLGSDAMSLATGVSAAGVAVGWSGSSSGTPSLQHVQDAAQHAFLYDGTTTAQLSTLVTGSNPFSNLQAATAISNNGNYIVGYGPVGGVMHGFLLSAVPEPSTLLLAAAGLVGLLACAWRKRL
jgi:hypothetical protein